jgi:hypothetical protein
MELSLHGGGGSGETGALYSPFDMYRYESILSTTKTKR